MAIFPNIAPEYLDEKDRGMINRMNSFYADNINMNQYFWAEADTDVRFESSDQSLWSELYGAMPISRRRQFNFNRIRPIVNMISGCQRRNRKSTIVTPVEAGDEETADQFTKILMWNDQQEGVLETISKAFHSSLITGMSFLHVWVDYRYDPINGDIRVDALPYNAFLVDPFFRKLDLSDCNGIWKRSYVTKRQAIGLLPAKSDELMGLSGNEAKDGKFHFMPEAYNYNLRDLFTYDEFYYRATREQRIVVDTKTGKTIEWIHEDEDGLKQFLATFPQLTIIKNQVPTVQMAIVVQGKVQYDGPCLTGDDWPFIPVVSYYTPESPYIYNRVQGIVRSMRDPQFLYNRFLISIADILESQVTSGFKYKENALVNPADVFMTGAGKGIALKEEAQMTDVEKIPPAEAGQSAFQLAEILSGEMFKVTGANEELMGSAVDEKAGILSMLRQGAGLTTLQGVFDNLDYAQKQLGRLRLKVIQNNFNPAKVKRIIAGEPTQQFYDKVFGKYDAEVEEGLNTTTQRQMQFAQLIQLKELGIPIPDDVMVGAVTIQNKKEIMDSLKRQSEQTAQMQQQQQQVAMQELQAREELARARAQADRGLAVERVSRVQENEALAVERKATAVRDENQAMLNLVKALKELDTIDLGHIQQLIQMQGLIKQQEQVVSSETGGMEKPPKVKPTPMAKKPKAQKAIV